MRIIENTKIWFASSLIIITIGLIMMLTSGLNYGIDFTGGTLIEINLHKNVPTSEIKSITDSVDKNMVVIRLGENKNTVQLKSKKDFDSDERQAIFNKFKDKYNLKETDLERADQFGPAIGKEIRNKAVISVLLASLGILIYVSFRFEVAYGIAAIVALLHDILIVISIYAIFRIPVNSPFVAAILTVVGYSINDTIVVFDRIRENLKKSSGKKDYAFIANDSIGQTLGRSINTSLTTLISIIALYIIGVESIKDFTLPLIAGITAGTFSSIFIASPIWVILKNKGK